MLSAILSHIILVVLAVVAIVPSFLFMKTKLGKAMHAASQQPRGYVFVAIT